MERSRRDLKRRSDLSDDEPRCMYSSLEELPLLRNSSLIMPRILFFTAKRHKRTTSDPQPPPVEAKLLDDLFKRTKASPSIYWLPLSEEQVGILFLHPFGLQFVDVENTETVICGIDRCETRGQAEAFRRHQQTIEGQKRRSRTSQKGQRASQKQTLNARFSSSHC